jgi:hypothetical protein
MGFNSAFKGLNWTAKRVNEKELSRKYKVLPQVLSSNSSPDTEFLFDFPHTLNGWAVVSPRYVPHPSASISFEFFTDFVPTL